MNRFDRKYRRIAKGISPLEISGTFSKTDLSWDDLFVGGEVNAHSDLFLGKYSESGIKFIMDRFGLSRQAQHLGLRNLSVQINTADPFRHMLTIYSGATRDRDHIIMEFVARYQHLTPNNDESEFTYSAPLRVLMVEWLLLQNPKSAFTQRRPRLPGQEHPGLGLGDQLLALFTLMGRHLRVDGIVNVPEYFHTGLIFGRRFVFLSPHVQAQVQQVAQDLWKKYRLAIIAWGSATGSIYDLDTGDPFEWKPRRQIIAINPKLRQYFKSPRYQDIAADLSKQPRYGLDETQLREAISRMDPQPLIL